MKREGKKTLNCFWTALRWWAYAWGNWAWHLPLAHATALIASVAFGFRWSATWARTGQDRTGEESNASKGRHRKKQWQRGDEGRGLGAEIVRGRAHVRFEWHFDGPLNCKMNGKVNACAAHKAYTQCPTQCKARSLSVETCCRNVWMQVNAVEQITFANECAHIHSHSLTHSLTRANQNAKININLSCILVALLDMIYG